LKQTKWEAGAAHKVCSIAFSFLYLPAIQGILCGAGWF